MEKAMETASEIAAILNICGAVAIAVLMVETTRVNRLAEQGQKIWAGVRRGVYAAVATSLFCSGLFMLKDEVTLPAPVAICWIVVLLAMVFFPLIRAVGLIDQDHWIGFRGRKERR